MNNKLIGPLVLIAIGIVFLINNLAYHLNFWRVIGDFWPVGLIVLGGAQLFQAVRQRQSFTGALVILLIGVAFQIHELYPEFSVGRIFRTYWPVALIAAGASQLFQMRGSRRVS